MRLVHLNISKRIIKQFAWVSPKSLVKHEKVISKNSGALQDYLRNPTNVSATIPSILACGESNMIIDGHHRTQVLTELGYDKVPVLFLNYLHDDILTAPEHGLDKDLIMKSAINHIPFEPKQTCHLVRDKDNNVHPIVTLAPTVAIPKPQDK